MGRRRSVGERQNRLDPGPGSAAVGLRGTVELVHAGETRAEDRATLGSDPSADSAAGMAGEAVLPPPLVNAAASGCAVGAGCCAFPRDSGHSGGKAINPGGWGAEPPKPAGEPADQRATPGGAAAYQRERHWANSFLLAACIRRAHSVSLSRWACSARCSALRPCFKHFTQSSSESSFSYGVR